MVIAFVTPRSMASRNCQREINFALSREKPFLSIFLEKTEMPLGMDMQLSGQQSIFRYNYLKETDFLNKILRCPDLGPCKNKDQRAASGCESRHVPGENSAEPIMETSPVLSSDDRNEAVPGVPAAGGPAGKTEMPPAEKKKKKEHFKKGPGHASALPLKKMAVPLILVFAAVLTAVFLLLPRSINTSWGYSFMKDSKYVSATGQKITQTDLESIAGLKKLQSLTFTRCDFTGCSFDNIRFASQELNELHLDSCTGIENCGFLSDLTLKYLSLTGLEAFSDLSLLDLSSMYSLTLDKTGVTDLSDLAGTKITRLSFRDTNVSDMAWAAEIPSLNSICGSGSGITSLSPLSVLEDLDTIDFHDCSLTDVPQELDSIRLMNVDLSGCGLENADLLGSCTVIENLNLSGNPLLGNAADLLSRNRETLKVLDLSDTGIGKESLEALGGCVHLTDLVVSGLALTDLHFVSNMQGLKSLRAENCGISDISGLEKLKNLWNLMLSFNRISDISVLEQCLDPASHKTVLDLSFNPLSDAGQLPEGHYSALLLHGTDEKIALSLPSGATASTISVPWTGSIADSVLVNKGKYSEILLVDCPKSAMVSAEEALGKSYLRFVTEDELMDLMKEHRTDYSYELNYDYPYAVYKDRQQNSSSPE